MNTRTHILVGSLLVIALAAALALLASGPARASAALPSSSEGDKIILSFNPSDVLIGVDEVFTVTLRVQAGSHEVEIASVYVDFNPKVLQVVTLVPGTALPEIGWWIDEFVNNDEGHVNFGSYAPLGQQGVSGSFDLVSIQMRAIRTSIGSMLTLSQVGERQTALVFGGYPLPLQMGEARVVVGQPTPTPSPEPSPTPWPTARYGLTLPLILRMN